ncbi:Crp/Fnr family transcriptional regulator [Streptomyces sp. NBRC 109706]|uniref:Crp/Fnr family transcriptional regulator n=1 Tax=Streptomyces sp. NBRC 109706 TaxID=1550035 RepID=UPI0018FE8DB0|nr:Crp/Fnr family transcriptional regulator [Streptomyces sp. NBRC 109706]
MTNAVNGRAGGRPREAWAWPVESLLGALPAAARDRLLTLGALARYPPGRVLMREAEETTFVLILLDGVIKVTGRTHDHRDALLAVRMGGDLVGEFAAVDGRPRAATVTTCGQVVTRVVSRGDFLNCTRHDPGIAQAVNESIISKLRVATTQRIDFTGCDAPTRLARVLYQITMTYGERAGARAVIRWPITQPELATLAGTAEPTVQKALRRLRTEGVVSTGYRTFRIENLPELRRLAFD